MDSSPDDKFTSAFFRRHPNLRSAAYVVTSDRDENYNCVAWALGRTDHWFEPGGYKGCCWPPGVREDASIEAYVELFAAFGFEPNASSSFKRGLEKVALYADDGEFTHVAVQADEGWSSKCGELHDISHRLLGDLEDDFYGRVVAILGWQTLSPRG